MSAPATVAKDVAKGIGHSAKAIAIMPLDIWVALTLGFRNAPRLYGDRSVRPPPDTITGFRSGVKAAVDELLLGFYDGVTGLVRLPYLDVKEDGIVGLPKGVCKGIGGLVLKPTSGILGIGSYTGKGIQAGIRKRVRDTYKTERWIRRARINQGAKDVREYCAEAGKKNGLEEVRTEVLRQWASRERNLVAEARKKEERRSFPEIGKRETRRRSQCE